MDAQNPLGPHEPQEPLDPNPQRRADRQAPQNPNPQDAPARQAANPQGTQNSDSRQARQAPWRQQESFDPEDARSSDDTEFRQLLAQVYEQPYRYDYFALLRRLSAHWKDMPRWGLAPLPSAERLRIGQEPSLAFAPASFTKAESVKSPNAVIRLRQAFFGYIGPNGPLPIHLSDLVRERIIHHQDRTLLLFLDQFTHRFALHFYRAWAQSQPTEGLDRPEEKEANNFHRRVGSLIGIGFGRQDLDAAHDDARCFFAGWFARQVRNRDGLRAVLSGYFAVPVDVRPWHGRWMKLPEGAVTHLGRAASTLGRTALLGTRVWDRHSHMEVQLGPMKRARFTDFLPSGTALPALQGLLRHYTNDEWRIQLTLSLRADDVPATRLGRGVDKPSCLGWTTWLGNRPRQNDAQDVKIDMDRWQRAAIRKNSRTPAQIGALDAVEA